MGGERRAQGGQGGPSGHNATRHASSENLSLVDIVLDLEVEKNSDQDLLCVWAHAFACRVAEKTTWQMYFDLLKV